MGVRRQAITKRPERWLIHDEPYQKQLQIVIIIDELVDLRWLLQVRLRIQSSSCPDGSNAGIHLIIATQRPSANVITG